MKGRLITLEGLDGAGKTTHLGWIAGRLEARGIAVLGTREPGGTPLGEALRALLLDPKQRFHPETEVLLMFAARREHLDKVILPALAAGTWIVCDRFTDASYAYQAGGSDVPWEKVAELERWVHPALQPDLTLYFDVSPQLGRSRAAAARSPDRYEQERPGFHERVRTAYLRRALEERSRMRVVDAARPITEIHVELEDIISSLCE